MGTADDVAPNVDNAGTNLAVHGRQCRINCTPLKIYLSSDELHIKEAQDESAPPVVASSEELVNTELCDDGFEHVLAPAGSRLQLLLTCLDLMQIHVLACSGHEIRKPPIAQQQRTAARGLSFKLP